LPLGAQLGGFQKDDYQAVEGVDFVFAQVYSLNEAVAKIFRYGIVYQTS
jgi:hypothetical protein